MLRTLQIITYNKLTIKLAKFKKTGRIVNQLLNVPGVPPIQFLMIDPSICFFFSWLIGIRIKMEVSSNSSKLVRYVVLHVPVDAKEK